MASSGKKSKNSQQARTLHTQQVILSVIGVILILSMIISLVAKY